MPLATNTAQLNQIYARTLAQKPFTPQHRCPGESQINADLLRAFPRGVDAVVYSQTATQSGWTPIPNTQGIIAILIGLVVAPAAAPARRQHKPLFLKPGAPVGYASLGRENSIECIQWEWVEGGFRSR